MIASLRQLGLTPAKGALVAVLAISLAVVWGPQLATLIGGSEQPPGRRPATAIATSRLDSTSNRPSRQGNEPGQAAKEAAPGPERPKSLVGLAEAVSHDPFAAPAWSPEARRVAAASSGRVDAPAPSELEERFEVLRSSGVAMILTSEKGQAVQIGEEMLRVGDRFEGFEVVEITPTGVVFRPAAEGEDDRGA